MSPVELLCMCGVLCAFAFFLGFRFGVSWERWDWIQAARTGNTMRFEKEAIIEDVYSVVAVRPSTSRETE